MNLKQLIKDKHDIAENHKFIKYLFSGSISTLIYLNYLNNQSLVYKALEDRADFFNLLEEVKNIKRYNLIIEDIKFLGDSNNTFKVYPSIVKYVSYVSTLSEDKVLSHIYVRHFGDIYGGSIIKKYIPGNGKMYEFENKNDLIIKIKSKLNLNMAEEANLVFDYVINFYEEISNEFNI